MVTPDCLYLHILLINIFIHAPTCIYMFVLIACVAGTVVTTLDGESVVCRVALVCATLDLPARAAVLNMIQFNGYWGCCRCLQKGI